MDRITSAVLSAENGAGLNIQTADLFAQNDGSLPAGYTVWLLDRSGEFVLAGPFSFEEAGDQARRLVQCGIPRAQVRGSGGYVLSEYAWIAEFDCAAILLRPAGKR